MADPVDREAPTPRLSFGFALAKSRAELCADTLTAIARTKSRVPHAIDATGERCARGLAQEALLLAARFKAWPELDAEEVAEERERLLYELAALEARARELEATIPPQPPRP